MALCGMILPPLQLYSLTPSLPVFAASLIYNCRNWKWVAPCAFVILVGLGFGLFTAEFVTDAAELWSEKGTLGQQHQEDSNKHFGNLYRTEMLNAVPKAKGEFLTRDAIIQLYFLESALSALVVEYDGGYWGLQDLCYRPDDALACAVFSVTDYWNTNSGPFDNWMSNFLNNNCNFAGEQQWQDHCDKPLTYTVSQPTARDKMGSGKAGALMWVMEAPGEGDER
ncbi:NPC1, partial [Symbiodinium sp. KB8]